MLDVAYSPTFVKRYGACERLLQLEIKNKIDLFRDRKNHQQLKVHKLHGHMKDRYSFSVNYHLRIIFCWLTKNEAYLLTVDDHDIYR